MPASPVTYREIGSVPGIFNREIFEWTVHEDETVKHDVPDEAGSDCSLRRNKLFPSRSLIERHLQSHLENNGGTTDRSVRPLANAGR